MTTENGIKCNLNTRLNVCFSCVFIFYVYGQYFKYETFHDQKIRYDFYVYPRAYPKYLVC